MRILSNGIVPMFSEPYSSSMPQTLQSQERDIHLWPSLTILPLQTPPVRARGTTIHLVSTKLGSIPLFEHQPDLEVVVYIAGLRKESVRELGEIREMYHPWPSPHRQILPPPLPCLILPSSPGLAHRKVIHHVSTNNTHLVLVLEVFI